MRFYLASWFLFPRSVRLRLFGLCYGATHLPLLTYIGWGALTGRLALADVVMLLLATLIGTGIALAGVGALLRAIHAATDALRTLKAGATDARMGALDRAQQDALTGVRNRRGFLADIAAGDGGARGAIALIDIDHFKRVNDRLGQDAGDRVLRGVADRLSDEVRRRDLLARWGGEEFAILFRDMTEAEAVAAVERVARTLIDDPVARVEGRPVTFSAGVAQYRQGGLETALDQADEGLYAAKHGGRNRVVASALLAAPLAH